MAGSEPPALHNALRLRAKPTYKKTYKEVFTLRLAKTQKCDIRFNALCGLPEILHLVSGSKPGKIRPVLSTGSRWLVPSLRPSTTLYVSEQNQHTKKHIKKYSLCGLQKRKSATSDSTHFAACPKYYIWLVDLNREKFGQSHSSTLVLAVDRWFRASGPPQRSTYPSKTNIPKNI